MALVFKRRVGDVVMIGDEVSVRVAEIREGHVVLAFDAPQHVKIHRLEVWQRVREERSSRCSPTSASPSGTAA